MKNNLRHPVLFPSFSLIPVPLSAFIFLLSPLIHLHPFPPPLPYVTSFCTYVNSDASTRSPGKRRDPLSLRCAVHINRTGDPLVSLFQRPRADPIEKGQRDNGYGRATRFPLPDVSEHTWDPTEGFFFLSSDVQAKRETEKALYGRMICADFNFFLLGNLILSSITIFLLFTRRNHVWFSVV